jgi:hypothetical protein
MGRVTSARMPQKMNVMGLHCTVHMAEDGTEKRAVPLSFIVYLIDQLFTQGV